MRIVIGRPCGYKERFSAADSARLPYFGPLVAPRPRPGLLPELPGAVAPALSMGEAEDAPAVGTADVGAPEVACTGAAACEAPGVPDASVAATGAAVRDGSAAAEEVPVASVGGADGAAF